MVSPSCCNLWVKRGSFFLCFVFGGAESGGMRISKSQLVGIRVLENDFFSQGELVGDDGEVVLRVGAEPNELLGSLGIIGDHHRANVVEGKAFSNR